MVLSVVALISKTTINGIGYSTLLWRSNEEHSNHIDTFSNLILLQESNHSFDVILSSGGLVSTEIIHVQDLQFMNNSISPPFYHRHLQYWTNIPPEIDPSKKGHFLIELPSIPEKLEQGERPNEEYSRTLRIHNSTDGSLLLSLTWQTVTHSMITEDSILWLEDNTCGFSNSSELLDAAVEDYVKSHTRRNSLLPILPLNSSSSSLNGGNLNTIDGGGGGQLIENIDFLSQIGYWLYSTPLGNFIRGSKIETSGRPLKLQKLSNSTISLIGRNDISSSPNLPPSTQELLPSVLPVYSKDIIMHLCQYHLISTSSLPDVDFLVAWLISIGWALISSKDDTTTDTTQVPSFTPFIDLLFQFDCGDSSISNIHCTINDRIIFIEIILISQNDSPLHDRRGPWLKNCFIDFVYHCIYKSVGVPVDLLLHWSSKCHVEYSHLPSVNSLIYPFNPFSEYDPIPDIGRIFEVLTWSPFIMDWVLSSIRLCGGGDGFNKISRLQFLQNDSNMILNSLRLTQCKLSIIKDDTKRFILQGPCNIMVCFFPCQGGRKVALDLMHLMNYYISIDRSILSINNDPIMKKWESYFWFSYRKGIPVRLGDTILTSDAGFGCMVRACQGIVAEALKRCLLPSSFELDDRFNFKEYRDILKMFADDGKALFGIHSILRRGIQFGVPIGQCFGPSIISSIIDEIITENIKDLPFKSIFLKDGSSHFHREELYQSLEVGKGLLILLPLQLGVQFLNPEYDSLIRGILKHPNSLGLAGGHGGKYKSRSNKNMKTLTGSRTGKAYHVLGIEEGNDAQRASKNEFNILYLDPHEIREVPDNLDEAIINREYHTKGMGVMPINQLNPSILFAFLINHKDEITVLSNYLVNLSKDIFTK